MQIREFRFNGQIVSNLVFNGQNVNVLTGGSTRQGAAQFATGFEKQRELRSDITWINPQTMDAQARGFSTFRSSRSNNGNNGFTLQQAISTMSRGGAIGLLRGDELTFCASHRRSGDSGTHRTVMMTGRNNVAQSTGGDSSSVMNDAAGRRIANMLVHGHSNQMNNNSPVASELIIWISRLDSRGLFGNNQTALFLWDWRSIVDLSFWRRS